MATKADAYVNAFMQTLANQFASATAGVEVEVELNQQLTTIFARILSRQITFDENEAQPGQQPFATLAPVFTFVASPTAERPVQGPIVGYDPAQINAAEASAQDAADNFDPVPGEVDFTVVDETPFQLDQDAEPSSVEITASAGNLSSLNTLSLEIGGELNEEGELVGAQLVEVTDIDTSGETNQAVIENLLASLNDNQTFSQAGLVASYEGDVLTVTNADGERLSDVQLLDAGRDPEPSTVTISNLLQGQLVTAASLSLAIGGEFVEIEGIEGNNGPAVAASIQDKLRTYAGPNDDEPLAEVTVAFANNTLTITDPNGRPIQDVSLLDAGDSARSTVVRIPNIDFADAQGVARFEAEIGAYEVVIDIAEPSGGVNLASKLQTAIRTWSPADSDETPFSNVAVAYNSANNRLEITDDQGRPVDIGSVQLLSEAEGAQASGATITGLNDGIADLDVGRFSANVGDTVQVTLADVNTNGGLTGLAAKIQSALRAADGGRDAIEAKVEGTEIVITDARGRAFTDVELGTAGEAATATRWEIGGVTDDNLGDIDVFSIRVPGANEGNLIKVEGNALNTSSLAALASSIETALNAADSTGTPFEVSVIANTLTITDAKGRVLSDLALENTEGAVPSVATITGLNNAVSRLDATRLSVTIGETEISLADVGINDEDGDTADLAAAIEAAIGDPDVTAVANASGTTITLSDAQGRTISDLSLTTEGNDVTPAVATMFGVVPPENADEVQAFAAEVAINEGGKLETVNVTVDLRNVVSIQAIKTAIQNAFDDAIGTDDVVTVQYFDDNGTEINSGETGLASTLVITNTQGYAITNLALTSDSVAEVAGEVTIALTDQQAPNAATFSIDVGDETVTVDVSGSVDGAAVAQTLNDDADFSGNGLAASWAGDVLTITGPDDGTTLAEASLVNAGTAGEVSIALTDAQAQEAESFHIMVGTGDDAMGVDVDLIGSNGDAAAVASAIDGTAIGGTGETLTAAWVEDEENAGAGTLTITGPVGKMLSHTQLMDDNNSAANQAAVGDGEYVLKNPSDAYVDGALKPGFEAPDQGSFGADTVTLNLAQGETLDLLQIYGTTIGTDESKREVLELGGVENGDLDAALDSIEFAKNQTGYNGVFNEKEFLSVKLNFADDGGTIELFDLIALDRLDSGLGLGGATETYQTANNPSNLIDFLEAAGNLKVQADGYPDPYEVVSGEPIILGQAYAVNGNDEIVIKNPSDVYQIDSEGNIVLRPDFEAPDQGSFGADTVTLNHSQISSATKLQIYGQTLGTDESKRDVLQLGEVADTDALIEALAGIEVAYGQTPYANIFDDKGFLSVKLNFDNGGSIELLDLIALNADIDGETVEAAVETALGSTALSAEYQEATNEAQIEALIDILTADGNLVLQGSAYTGTHSVDAPIVLGEVYGAVQVGDNPDETAASADAVAPTQVGGTPTVATEAAPFGPGSNSYAEETVPTEEGSPQGANGTPLGTVNITEGFPADERPEEVIFNVGNDPELAQEGVIAGTGSEPIPEAEIAIQEGDEGIREEIGGPAVLQQTGQEAGANAEQVGADPVITEGIEAGSDPEPVVGEDAIVIIDGEPATNATAWTATLDVTIGADGLDESYAFSLTLTKLLGDDPDEGEGAEPEPMVSEFTVEADAGDTAADVLNAMAASIDPDVFFTAMLNEENQLVVTAVEMETNYAAEASAMELVGVQEESLDFAA